MQPPNQFQHIQHVDQIPSFPLAIEELSINGENTGPMETTVSYDEKGNVLLSLGSFFTQKFWREKANHDMVHEVQMKCKAISDPYEGYITTIKLPPGLDNPIVEASLSSPALSRVDSPSSNRFEALLLSAPQIKKLPIFLNDGHGTTIEIGSSKSEKGRVSLIKVYAKTSANNPLVALAPLRSFLTFVKGTNCGLGHLIAYDASDSVSLKFPGFTHTDPNNLAPHWFHYSIEECLPDIFLLFLKACKDEKTNRALRQSIDSYRASNASFPVSLDVSIIKSCSAMEIIVNHILSHLDNWSNTKLGDSPLKIKSKSAAKYFGLEVGSLSQSPELLEYLSENNNSDVFTIISKIRNKLVHQDIDTAFSGKLLCQAWQVSQWLVELLVFGVIDYRGLMVDRRTFGVHSSKVPLFLSRDPPRL